jgi:hypothetical protein
MSNRPTFYEQRAAEGRQQVSDFFGGVKDFFTIDSSKHVGSPKPAAPPANPSPQEVAKGTRVDQLTNQQRALINPGANPLALSNFGTLNYDAELKAAGVITGWPPSSKQETPPRTGGTVGFGTGAGGSAAAQGSKPDTREPLNFADAPSPSSESQPRLEDDPNNAVRQGSRFTRDGESRTQSFNINSFRSEILENEVLSTHSYLVTFSPFRMGFKENEPLTEFITNKRNTLVLRCENVVLPAPALLEEENIRRYGYGPVEKVPYGVQFSDVTMTWLVDNRSEIINFFNQWMNTIVLHNSPNTLMNATAVRPSERGLTTGLDAYDPFELGYKDAYTNPIVRIYVYNKQNQTTTTYEMYDVFPLNIQAMNLSWADENETQKLSVTFAYTNMRVGAPQAQKLNRVVNVNFDSNRPALMEKIPLSEVNFGITDKVSSPSNVSITTSVNASTPNATEPIQPPAISSELEGLPVIRDFTA